MEEENRREHSHDETSDNRNEQEKWLRRLADSEKRLPIRLTNDFAFKRTFHNKVALTGLLSALLHISPGEITDIAFKDPIMPGEFVKDKTGVLDLYLTLNQERKINIEIQVAPYPFWEERSLFYLAKMYVEDFPAGGRYSELKECIHISILAFGIFEEGFFSSVRLMDEKSHRIYSDKLQLFVLQLNKLEQADEEERQTEVYRWARLLITDDWKELEAMANGNQYMEAAIEELERLNSDKELRYEYLRRMKEMSDKATLEGYYQDKDEEYARRDEEFARKITEFIRKDEEFARKDEEFARKDEEFARKDEEFARKDKEFVKKEKVYARKDEEYARKEAEYAEKESRFAEAEARIAREREELTVTRLLLKGYTEEQIISETGISAKRVKEIRAEFT